MWRAALLLLTALLLFSLYMTFYTSSLNNQTPRLVVVFPEKGYSPPSVDYVLKILGDGLLQVVSQQLS